MADKLEIKEDTMFKVYKALEKAGLHHVEIQNVIAAIQNAGVVFAERTL